MDRREAIQKIEAIIDNGQDYGYWTDAQRKALDLAIEALEREIEYGQMVVDFTKGETMKSDEWKYDTACDAETATTTEVDYCNNCPYLPWGEDCISRDGLLFALEPMMEDWEGMKTVKLIIETIPPVNQKQVTVKLNNPVDSLLTADSDECKEQKSKLDDKLQSSQETSTNVDGYRVEARSISKLDSGDIISRQEAINAICEYSSWNKTYETFAEGVRNCLLAIPSATTTDCISRADTIKAMCQECKGFPDDEVNCADCTEVAIVKGMPSVLPDFKTFCGVPIEEAIEVLEKHKYAPSITPTERESGEWVRVFDDDVNTCSKCYSGYNRAFLSDEWNYCPNCGADMRGEEE